MSPAIADPLPLTLKQSIISRPREIMLKIFDFLCIFSTSDNATEMADHFLERKFAPELIYGHIRKLVLTVLCKKGPILFKHAAKNIINTGKHVEFLKVSLLTCSAIKS